MGVDRFEDLRVWRAASAFATDIGSVLQRMSSSTDFALRDQLNAAALSTVANIAEGFMRRSRRDFARFTRIAAASNGEARALLHIAHGRGHLRSAEYLALVDTTNSIGRMLSALYRSLRTAEEPHQIE
jgi:four helix bundle protein